MFRVRRQLAARTCSRREPGIYAYVVRQHSTRFKLANLLLFRPYRGIFPARYSFHWFRESPGRLAPPVATAFGPSGASSLHALGTALLPAIATSVRAPLGSMKHIAIIIAFLKRAPAGALPVSMVVL